MAPEIDPKSFGTYEKQAPGPAGLASLQMECVTSVKCGQLLITKLVILPERGQFDQRLRRYVSQLDDLAGLSL